MDVELINWLKDGKYRIKTLRLISAKPMLSSELANRLGINRASMSRILRGLKERDLVSAVSGKTRTVTYTLTEKGLEILKVWERYFSGTNQAI
jgi:DNA-binding MarR family transcriptional regulator